MSYLRERIIEENIHEIQAIKNKSYSSYHHHVIVLYWKCSLHDQFIPYALKYSYSTNLQKKNI